MALVDVVKKYRVGPTSYTAQQIMDQDSAKPTTIIPGFVSQGVTLLVAKQKVGKSFLCLQMGLQVAGGGKIFGMDVQAQDVFYLALEDTHGLMKERLHKMLSGASVPKGLHVNFNWPRLEDSGLEELEEWLRQHRETRLVIIDTFAKICHVKQGTYDADYEAIAKFKYIADKHKIAIVLVHHMRKTGAK